MGQKIIVSDPDICSFLRSYRATQILLSLSESIARDITSLESYSRTRTCIPFLLIQDISVFFLGCPFRGTDDVLVSVVFVTLQRKIEDISQMIPSEQEEKKKIKSTLSNVCFTGNCL